MVQILYKKMRKRFRRLKKIATIAEASFIVKSDFYDNKHFFLQMFMREFLGQTFERLKKSISSLIIS